MTVFMKGKGECGIDKVMTEHDFEHMVKDHMLEDYKSVLVSRGLIPEKGSVFEP